MGTKKLTVVIDAGFGVCHSKRFHSPRGVNFLTSGDPVCFHQIKY